jgi:hypothetical protein
LFKHFSLLLFFLPILFCFSTKQYYALAIILECCQNVELCEVFPKRARQREQKEEKEEKGGMSRGLRKKRGGKGCF